MKTSLNNIIKGKHKKPILTDYFYKKDNQLKPIVIFCHGYKGYKDWGSWNIMAKEFAKADLFFVKFNFSHNGGTIENPIDFPDIKSFSLNNFSIELDDLDSVINSVLTNIAFKNEVDKTNIIVIGHSRGGGIAVLRANLDKRISKVISWNGISDIESRFPKGEQLAVWKKEDIAFIQNTRTKQQLPIRYQMYENFMANKEKLYIKAAIENIKIPQLIIQGSADMVVLPKEAQKMHQWNPKSKLVIIEDMDHGLGNKQPWEEKRTPLFLEKTIEQTILFIKE